MSFLIEEKATSLKMINISEKYKFRAIRKQREKLFPVWDQERLEYLAFVLGLQVGFDYLQGEIGKENASKGNKFQCLMKFELESEGQFLRKEMMKVYLH